MTGRKVPGRGWRLSLFSINSRARSIAEALKRSRRIRRLSPLLSKGSRTVTMRPWITPGRKPSFLPLGHSEDLKKQEHVVKLAEELVKEAPEELRGILEFSANQARGHRDVIARFGRHPHRNEVLGRQSTRRNSSTSQPANSSIRVRSSNRSIDSFRNPLSNLSMSLPRQARKAISAGGRIGLRLKTSANPEKNVQAFQKTSGYEFREHDRIEDSAPNFFCELKIHDT